MAQAWEIYQARLCLKFALWLGDAQIRAMWMGHVTNRMMCKGLHSRHKRVAGGCARGRRPCGVVAIIGGQPFAPNQFCSLRGGWSLCLGKGIFVQCLKDFVICVCLSEFVSCCYVGL